MASDWELLETFAEKKEEGAFDELVKRYLDSVYGMARRMLGGPGSEAEDVTQAVFLLLARKAGSIRRSGALAGWLFRATRYCCANVRKMAGRRRRHEREAAMRKVIDKKVQADLSGVLDEGLATLGEKERQAILVKFLGRKTAAEAGMVLGISAEAVDKRVERGIGKLRTFFGKCGFVVPAAAVVTVMGAEGAKGAPAGLRVWHGVGASGTAGVIAKGAAAMMRWTKVISAGAVLATALVTAVAVVVVVEGMGRAGASVPTVGAISKPEVESDQTLVVSGQVLDEDGKVVGGAIVGLPPGTGFGVTADGDGKFTISAEAKDLPGKAPSYLFVREFDRNLAVCVPVEKSVEGLKVTVLPAAKIVGRCVDEVGNVLGDVQVGLLISPVSRLKMGWSDAGFARNAVKADGEGRFEFTALPLSEDFSYIVGAWSGRTNAEGRKDVPVAKAGEKMIDVGDLVLNKKRGG